ncbi:MAG: hypothetical protein Q8P31_04270 [Bacillota bacterium]|nr:hypothetical protein [Bacillota bacterium]
MITAGKQFVFMFFAFMIVVLLYRMDRAKKGNLPWIRRIAGLQAIDEAVGRATELGTPVFYVPGRTEINTSGAAQTMAGLEILGHVAGLTAKYDTELITAIAAPNVQPVAEEIVRQAYVAAGKAEALKPEMVQFLSNEQFAFAAACLAIMNREHPGAAIMVGEFQAETMMLVEAAAQTGAITICGTSRAIQIPFFVAAADYTLIGEEMFAGGAYLTRDPNKLGSIAALDVGKVLGTLIILIGAITMTAGNKSFLNFIKK